MNRKQLLLILLLFQCFITHAQTALSPQDFVIAEAATKNFKKKLSTPYGTGSLPNFFSSISLSSFYNEGVNGKIELNGKLGKGWNGGLSIDQKIGETDVEAVPLDLSGISPGTTVSFNLQKILWKPTFNLSHQQIQQLNEASKVYAARKQIADWRTVGLRDISMDGTAEEKKLALNAINSVSFKEPFFITARIGFTKTAFTYTTDSVNLVENSEAFLTPALTLSVVKALGSGFDVSGFIALSYSYNQYYTAFPKTTFSTPFGTTGNYYTTTLSFGKPVQTTSHTAMLEYRKNFFSKRNNDRYTNIAVSPSAIFGINTKTLGVFLPVYFIRGTDEKGNLLDGLQGGVRFGYITSTESGKLSSFKDGFTAQLLITQPLDFLNNF